jgi:hypothetical protein
MTRAHFNATAAVCLCLMALPAGARESLLEFGAGQMLLEWRDDSRARPIAVRLFISHRRRHSADPARLWSGLPQQRHN